MLTVPINREDVIDLAERIYPTYLAITLAERAEARMESGADPSTMGGASDDEIAEIASRRAIGAAHRFAQKAANYLKNKDADGEQRVA